MRTTVTLDPDAEQVVRDRMDKGVSFKQALNDAIRDGAGGRADYVFRSPTFAADFLVDVTKANALAAEVEDDALLERLAAGR